MDALKERKKRGGFVGRIHGRTDRGKGKERRGEERSVVGAKVERGKRGLRVSSPYVRGNFEYGFFFSSERAHGSKAEKVLDDRSSSSSCQKKRMDSVNTTGHKEKLVKRRSQRRGRRLGRNVT